MRQQQVFNEINITPLTDIFLVLLIIMMVVAPMLEYHGLKLSVPSVGPDVAATEEPSTINIIIDSEDRVFVEEKRLGKYEWVSAIRQLSEEKKDGVVIQADPQSSHDAMTQVMDAAQRAGITKVGVSRYEAPSE